MKSKADSLRLAQAWLQEWPVGTAGRLYPWGPVKVVEHSESNKWPVLVVETLRPYRGQLAGMRLYVFYGSRQGLTRF